MAEQRLQRPVVAGGGDDGVRGEPGPVRQDHRVPVERGDRRHRDHPAGPHRVDQPHVLDRDRPLAGAGGQAAVGAREAVGGQVGHGDPGHHGRRAVHEPYRQAADQDAGGLGRPARGGTAHDVRGGAHRDPYPRGPALRQVGRDLRARVADADDEDVPVRVRGGAAVVRRVQQLARVRVAARPVGDARGVVEPGGDDDRAAEQDPAARRGEPPVAGTVGRRVDAGHLDAGHHFQLVVLGVLLQVPHHVVPAHPAPEPARHLQPRQRRPAAGGVQAQPVVVAAPGRADPVRLLQHHRPYAPGAQRGGGGEAPGAAADDVDGAVVRAVGDGDGTTACGGGAVGHGSERNRPLC